ncbi:uncharacterized protein isoform X3 [Rhodnius prolixus]
MENLIIKQQKINKEMELLNNELYLKLFVNILIKKHDEIIINARLINTIFSWQNLCLCTICTIGFISNVYGVCVKLFLKLQIRALLLNITYFVHYFGIIQAVAYYCENLRGQIDNFNYLLVRFTSERSLSGFIDDDLQFYASRNRNVTFSAAGYFTLGYPLVTTFTILEIYRLWCFAVKNLEIRLTYSMTDCADLQLKELFKEIKKIMIYNFMPRRRETSNSQQLDTSVWDIHLLLQ